MNLMLLILSVAFLSFCVVPFLYAKKANVYVWVIAFAPFTAFAYWNSIWRAYEWPPIYYALEFVVLSLSLGVLFVWERRRKKVKKNSGD